MGFEPVRQIFLRNFAETLFAIAQVKHAFYIKY